MAEYQRFHVVQCVLGTNDSAVTSPASPRLWPLPASQVGGFCSHVCRPLPLLDTSFWKKVFVFLCLPLVIRLSGRTTATNTRLVNYLMIK